MIRNGFLALTASVMVCAVPANAATLVQRIDGARGPGYAQRLDPSVGTLNRVTIESAYVATVYFNNPSFGSAPPLVNASGRIGDNTLGFAEFSGQYQSILQQRGLISIALSGSSLKVITDNFSMFTGTGLTVLGGTVSNGRYSTVDGIGLAEVATDFPGQLGARYIVTYDFTPAIPEPATWALMLAGFAMTGYALRRRRATIAIA